MSRHANAQPEGDALHPLRVGQGRAPGKVILLGEHAVVYGWPAIALPVDRWVHVEVGPGNLVPTETDSGTLHGNTPPVSIRQLLSLAGSLLRLPAEHLAVRVNSAVPPGMGLGSSAALSVALIRAIADYYGIALEDGDVSNCAYKLECLFHGQPSGVDNTAVALGSLLRFVRGKSPLPLSAPAPLPLVVLLGDQPRSTRTVVELLQRRREHDPQTVDASFARIGQLAERAAAAIERGDWGILAVTMNENQRILHNLGVSTPEIDTLVAQALTAGAWAAKVTGAGGGGAVVCLCPENRAAFVERFLARGCQCFPVNWPPEDGGEHERYVAQSSISTERL
ncbi:MAG: mevalonate kinase [Candidatus Binatia bacterium]|nr:mevalonate kinase [Candidatus Binatia bacterium]